MMRAERKRIVSLGILGLSPAQAVDVISWSPSRTAAGGQETLLEGYFDASDRTEGGNVIIWWNNIERDSRYSRWPTSLTGVSSDDRPKGVSSNVGLACLCSSTGVLCLASSPQSGGTCTISLRYWICRCLPHWHSSQILLLRSYRETCPLDGALPRMWRRKQVPT
jgi:hypothetical protein